MKKVVWVVALVCAVAVGALPYWVGIRAEEAYRAAAEEWSQRGQFRLEVRSYRRGWLHSEAELLLTVEGWQFPPEAEDSELGKWSRWVQEDRIGHGPLPAVAAALGVPGFRPALAVVDSRVRLADPPAELVAALGDDPLAEARTVVSWDGSARAVVRGRPVEACLGEEGTVLWQGLEGTLEYPGRGRLAGRLSAPGLVWRSAGPRARLDALAVSFDLARSAEELILGEYRLEAARLTLEVPGQPGGSVEGIAISSTAVAAGDLVHAATTVEVKTVAAAGEVYGPVSLRLAANNLDAASLARWQALAPELQSRSRRPDELSSFLEEQFREVAPAFLARSPELELTRLRVGTPDGELTATGLVSFAGEGSVTLEDLRSLLEQVRAEARFTVPGAVARKVAAAQVRRQVSVRGGGEERSEEEVLRLSQTVAEEQLESLVAQRLLEFDGQAYTVGIRWSGGDLAVNGRPLGGGSR